MTTRYVATALLAPLVGFSLSAQEPSPQGAAKEAAAEACHTTFTSGSGPTFIKVCISATGNVQKFESPQGFEHIAVGDAVIEGYALCDQGVDLEDGFDNAAGYDGGSADASGGDFQDQAATISQPNGPNTFPLTITRDPAGNGLVLRQDFARDTARKELTITMRVTNKNTRTIQGVELSRFFDADADNQWWDNWGAQTRNAASIGRQHGLMLTATTFERRHTVSVTGFPGTAYMLGWPELFCGPPDGAGSPGVSQGQDLIGGVAYALGSISPGASKTVKVTYRRF